MIKLTQLISELGINNPNPTAKEVMNYYKSSVSNNSTVDFIRIIKPIIKKHGYKFPLGVKEFIMSLDQQALNKFYRELKSEFSNINELNINNPNPTWKEVYDYYELLLWKRGMDGMGESWDKIRPVFFRYGYYAGQGTNKFLEKLSPLDLNRFYKDLKQIEQDI